MRSSGIPTHAPHLELPQKSGLFALVEISEAWRLERSSIVYVTSLCVAPHKTLKRDFEHDSHALSFTWT